jgi:hypothetical protein
MTEESVPLRVRNRRRGCAEFGPLEGAALPRYIVPLVLYIFPVAKIVS